MTIQCRNTTMQSVRLFDTATLPQRERTTAWHALMSGTFGGIDSDVYGNDAFDGELSHCAIGSVRLIRLTADAHRVRRTAEQARHDDDACLKIVVPLQGHAVIQQHQREAMVRPGQWCIYDTAAPYAVLSPLRAEHLVIRIARTAATCRSSSLASLMSRPLGAPGVSRLARQAMQQAWADAPTLDDAAAHGIGLAIVQLVDLSLHELAGHADGPTRLASLRARIERHISAHLGDPALDAQHIAHALGCSRRSVYNALAGDGVAAHILEQRLLGAHATLSRREQASGLVTDVALTFGFTSPSSFSRAFSRRFGVAPVTLAKAPAA